MKVLLDTCVISEIRHPKGNRQVKDAVAALDEDAIYLSAITIGELHKGIHALPKSKRKNELSTWLSAIQQSYAERILPVDAEVASLWGEVTASAQADGFQLAAADGLIAATAISNGLHVMTRNISDFEPSGALLINPWAKSN